MAYASPGVYVEEVPSAIKPIAGVGTSTAGFIGVAEDEINQPLSKLINVKIGQGDNTETVFELQAYPVNEDKAQYKIKVNGVENAEAEAKNDDTKRIVTVTFSTAPANNTEITGDFLPTFKFADSDAAVPRLCTTFSDFKKFFGDFSDDKKHTYLAHAVFGFFNNGGSRCYVARVKSEGDVSKALEKFEAVDEVAIIAAPGLAGTDPVGRSTRTAIIAHCKERMQDRFAIFDTPEVIKDGGLGKAFNRQESEHVLPPVSDYAAVYFPWLEVLDPVTKSPTFVPPSGHVAGLYARVDSKPGAGVHRAPGGVEYPLFGTIGLKYKISKNQQDGLNPQGVNCIRDLSGNVIVWGVRTIGGDANADLKYINVRRTLLYLRESIEEGMQWAVFEPNTPALWQKIMRNITAFLTNELRSGRLFGNTPQEAFFVKCDAETNPPELRDLGQVVTEIGVAIARPAEFVIFRISQVAPQTK